MLILEVDVNWVTIDSLEGISLYELKALNKPLLAECREIVIVVSFPTLRRISV
jgi:hypothetical protein